MRDILTLQSLKKNPESAQETNVTIVERESLERDILTLQSMKENPKNARGTNVTIDER